MTRLFLWANELGRRAMGEHGIFHPVVAVSAMIGLVDYVSMSGGLCSVVSGEWG